MDNLLKPSIHQKRRPSDILADTLRFQASVIVNENRKKLSAGEEKLGIKSKKAVRFPLDVDLQEAVREGDVDSLKTMIHTYGKAILKVRDPVGHPLVVKAVREKQEEVLKLLIDEGSDLTMTDKAGYTALHAAAEEDAMKLAKMITDHKGCATNLASLKTRGGHRPIDLSISVEMADLLMHSDLEYFLNELDDIWMHNACSEEDEDEDKQSKAKLLKEDHLLHIIGGASHDKAQKYIEDFETINGCSLLHFAAWKNYSRLAFYIVEEELTSVDIVDRNRWTPLHTAVYHSNIDMTLLLIELGADIFAKNKAEQTPIYLAEDELIICILADAAEANSDSSESSDCETLSE